MKKLTKKSLDELAKIMPIIEEAYQMELVGGGSGTSSDPYTQSEYHGMSDNWGGGFVEGYGYIADDTYIFGNSGSSNSTPQEHFGSFSEYLTSLSSSKMDQLLNTFIESIPGVGQAVSNWSENLGNMTRDIQGELMKSGYNESSSFVVVQSEHSNGVKFTVYNADNGALITSRIITITGNWY